MSGGDERYLNLSFRGSRTANQGAKQAWDGFSIERVVMGGPREYDYSWSGKSHYVALHDLKLADGEIRVDEELQPRKLDLRNQITVIPQGCSVTGWSSLAARPNSFIMLSFDDDAFARELEKAQLSVSPEPVIHFSNGAIQSTMEKLQSAMSAGDALGDAYLETLALLAVLEVRRLWSRQDLPAMPAGAKLSSRQEKLVREYITENLDQRLSLSTVSSIAGLSRFHFIRAFGRTTGSTPHAYILRMRIDRAKQLLAETTLSIGAVGAQVGFKTPNHFSSAFRSAVGCTPGQYRRSVSGVESDP